MNILLINDNLNVGGSEIALQNFCAYLASKGHHLTIWAQQPDKDGEIMRQKYPAGTKYYRLPFWESPCGRFSPKWFFSRGCRVLFCDFLLQLKKWDVVIAFKEGPSMILASKLRADKKLAWVHTDYGSLHWSRHSFHSDEEERQCMAGFDHVVCVSHTTKNGIINTVGDPGNLCVRYNPLNVPLILSKAEDVPADCVRPGDRPLFVAVGRLSAVKRFDMLLDICARLEQRYDFELWIVGGGEDEASLKQKLADKKIKSVRLLGHRDNPFPYLAAADWFVSSSASEANPLALQEALVLQVPVVACHCPAVAEALDSRFGIIAPWDSEGLCSALEQILAKPELAREFRDSIRRFYPRDSMWKKRMEDMYSLVEGSSSGN